MQNLQGVDPSDQYALAVYYQSHAIPLVYNPGVIIASVVVSVLGCYSTLLLLGKQTNNKGFKNVGSSIVSEMAS